MSNRSLALKLSNDLHKDSKWFILFFIYTKLFVKILFRSIILVCLNVPSVWAFFSLLLLGCVFRDRGRVIPSSVHFACAATPM